MGPFDALNPTNSPRGGYVPPSNGLSIPQMRTPSPAVALPPSPTMSVLGSGNSNFKGFDTSAFANIGPQPLTPTLAKDLNAHTGVGGKLNFSC